MNKLFKFTMLFAIICLFTHAAYPQNDRIRNSLVAFWNFSEEEGQARKSSNFSGYPVFSLQEAKGPIRKVNDGPIGASAALIEDSNWFFIPRDSLGALNIYGKEAEVTVIAWIQKHSDKNWQAIAGVWDESHSKRQYYLFANASFKTHQDEMVRYPAKNLIHGHISASGGKSPGEVAWISYASSNDSIPSKEWAMVALTYDGKKIKVYINGKLSENIKTNPFCYTDGIFDGGAEGADFTVGANSVSGRMTNNFEGLISGLAVFKKALSEKELARIFKDADLLSPRKK